MKRVLYLLALLPALIIGVVARKPAGPKKVTCEGACKLPPPTLEPIYYDEDSSDEDEETTATTSTQEETDSEQEQEE